MKAKKAALLTLGVLAGWIVAPAPPASACSGPSPPIEMLLASATYVIQGRVVESDATAQTHIIKVESYLRGGPGPEYLLVQLNTLGRTQGLIDRRIGGGDCYEMYPEPPTEHSFYMLVERQRDGSYQTGSITSSQWYAFPEPDSTEDIIFFDEEHVDYPIVRSVTEMEFRDLVTDSSHITPTPPRPDLPYPRREPLLITTENGTRFMLPVDGDPPVAIHDEALAYWLIGNPGRETPFAHTDGCDRGVECKIGLIEDSLIVQQLIDGEPGAILGPYGVPLSPGDDALVSPVSEVAVWHDSSIAIYRPRLVSGYESEPYPPPTRAVFTLEGGADVRGSAFAQWGNYGRVFAYSDGRGLWVWDRTLHHQPQLIEEPINDVIPYARHFSPDGRYLAVTAGNDNFTIDRWSGDYLDDTLFSPDGRYVIYWPPPQFNLPSQLDYPHIRHIESGGRIYARRNEDAIWLGNHRYAKVSQGQVEYHDLSQPAIPPYVDAYLDTEPGRAIVMSDEGDIAVLVDDTTISINRQVIPIDLDAPIADIRWLRSLFWREWAVERPAG